MICVNLSMPSCILFQPSSSCIVSLIPELFICGGDDEKKSPQASAKVEHYDSSTLIRYKRYDAM
jgi:hypothetical protein